MVTKSKDETLTMLAEMAHEFQTPIAILAGSVEVLAAATGGQEAHIVRVAQTTLHRLSRLVKKLLEAAKYGAVRDWLEAAPLDVAGLIAETYDDCAMLAEEKGIAFIVESETVFVDGDRDKLKEVLLNLISNALTHTPRGGRISLMAHKKAAIVEIAVEDTGVGIAPENLLRIFERFYRIKHADGKDSAAGTGLGLHICKQIVEAHQGTISVASAPGKGSRFAIALTSSREKGRDIINACSQP